MSISGFKEIENEMMEMITMAILKDIQVYTSLIYVLILLVPEIVLNIRVQQLAAKFYQWRSIAFKHWK